MEVRPYGELAIPELTRWLTGLGVATRTGKTRWDRSGFGDMLRNPNYAGQASLSKPCAPSRPRA